MTARRTKSPTTFASESLHNGLLVTAQINILNDKTQSVRCRALLDTGSSMNFMTERLANSLGLTQRTCSVPIGVPDTLSTTARRYTTATINSTDGTYPRTLTFLIILTISTLILDKPVDRSTIQIPRNFQLVDLRFHIPALIDVVLSAGSTLASLCVGQIKLNYSKDPDLRLQKTRFEWIIGGAQSSIQR